MVRASGEPPPERPGTSMEAVDSEISTRKIRRPPEARQRMPESGSSPTYDLDDFPAPYDGAPFAGDRKVRRVRQDRREREMQLVAGSGHMQRDVFRRRRDRARCYADRRRRPDLVHRGNASAREKLLLPARFSWLQLHATSSALH